MSRIKSLPYSVSEVSRHLDTFAAHPDAQNPDGSLFNAVARLREVFQLLPVLDHLDIGLRDYIANWCDEMDYGEPDLSRCVEQLREKLSGVCIALSEEDKESWGVVRTFEVLVEFKVFTSIHVEATSEDAARDDVEKRLDNGELYVGHRALSVDDSESEVTEVLAR